MFKTHYFVTISPFLLWHLLNLGSEGMRWISAPHLGPHTPQPLASALWTVAAVLCASQWRFSEHDRGASLWADRYVFRRQPDAVWGLFLLSKSCLCDKSIPSDHSQCSGPIIPLGRVLSEDGGQWLREAWLLLTEHLSLGIVWKPTQSSFSFLIHQLIYIWCLSCTR